MKVSLSKYKWYNKDNIWVTGFIRQGNIYLKRDNLLNYFLGIDTIPKFEQILKNSNGQFSVIMKFSDQIWAATDRLRNYPVFYSQVNGEFVISDDAYFLSDLQKENKFNPDAYNSFLSCGYVLNNLTLLNNIYQIEAGEYVIFKDTVIRKFYHDYRYSLIVEKDFDNAAIELKELFNNVFRDHFKALKDKFIAISLSGGYDSRLVAAMCKQYHPENILCYTFGRKDNPEVKPAKETARRLGLKWINIVYDFELIDKGYLYDDTFNKYYRFTSNLCSMPYLQDYFAVKYLKENKIIPDDSVFMTGSTGDMLAGSHLSHFLEKRISREKLANILFIQFCDLMGIEKGRQKCVLQLIGDKIPQPEKNPWLLFENWDMKERQAKFIINSSNVYNFFGYDYINPLWDNAFSDFFSSQPFKYKINKKLYDFVLRNLIFDELGLNQKKESTFSYSKKTRQNIKEKFKQFLPYSVKSIFIRHDNPVFYDKLTALMIEDIGIKNIIRPKQSNSYNSYIVQWYLLKTKKMIESKLI